MLSWVERKVASALFGETPTSTFVEAREQFMEVEKLKPEQWKENLLYIAKARKQIGQLKILMNTSITN